MIDDLWYKNAVIYSLDVETFMDSNGDGIGDFEGLARRLDYLAGLGVTCLWLLPFQPSPNLDNGYDISDFYGVDSRYGSSGDFVDFAHQARQRGMKIIIDLVVNHTSDQHRWFQSARSDPKSPYRDWYTWSKKRPRDYDKGMVFPGVQKTTWSYDKKAHLWYYHRFFSFQPDLNTENLAVRTEIQRIMGYWLELGVSGFRVDAVPFLIETQGSGKKHKPQYEYLTELRDFLQWREGDGILLGEANVVPEEEINFFGTNGDRMHMLFNFYVNQHLFCAFASGDARPLVEALNATRRIPEFAQWASFLRNHDELDLGRLSRKHRQLVYEKFGPDPEMQLYGRGIRRRLSPMFNGDQRRLELAYSLLFSLPGTPVLRYGDEIGMGDDLSLPERASVRTAMQWSAEHNAGFSEAEKTVVPVIGKGPWGYQRVNVAAQRCEEHSLLNWNVRMIRLRKECPEIGWGSWKTLATRNPAVLALQFDWRNNSIVTLHNFSDSPQQVVIDVDVEQGNQLVSMLTYDRSDAFAGTKHRIVLEAYGYRWYRVGGLDYILKREKY